MATREHVGQQHASMSCCRAFPFIPLACLLILVVGIPIWVIYAQAAATATNDTLTAAGVDTSSLQSLLSTVDLIRTVVLALSVVTVLAVLALCVVHALRKAGRSRGGVNPSLCRSLIAADGTATALLWVVLTGAVVLVALTATLFLGSMAASGLLTMVTRFSTDAEKAANKAVASSQGLIDQLRIVQLAGLDVAPQEVKDNQWYKDFRNGVNNFNQTVANTAKTPSSADCQPGCISLDFLAGLAGLNSTCICLTKTINNVQTGLQATQQATLISLVGLVLIYLACSWLLIYLASAFTSARRDLKDHRRQQRLAKSSSAGDGLYASSGASSGSGSAADAAIDIRADDSPVGHKSVSAVGQRTGFPFMHDVVTADSRNERDVGRRLPFV